MATKGELTRERITIQSAALFNTRGYAGTSMADIIEASGIQKGGIYRHFASKEEIMQAALAYGIAQRVAAVKAAVEKETSAVHQLRACCTSFVDLLDASEPPGGCPLMNTAVEADDWLPALKAQAAEGMDLLRALVLQVVASGKARGDIGPFVSGEVVASVLIATCEGALMMSRLYDDPVHLQRALDFLGAWIDSLAA
jgi:TetR/AcrR family transcriptional regulator, transcriptional repressor for nem operon